VNKKPMGISVIVCSIDPVRCEALKSCIADTIGVEFEFLAFDNRVEKWGICKVYNHCAEKAVYPYLCFIHEDITITTKDWGTTLIKFAQSTQNCGVIGIAGGTAAYKNFILWADGWDDKDVRHHFRDPCRDGTMPKSTLVLRNYNPDNVDFTEVVTLDGCFLFTSQDIYNQKSFDEKTFPGFHFYDADFTLDVAQIKQNYVCYKIDIHHFSNGSYNGDYYKNAKEFQIKWKDVLPFTVENSKTNIKREQILAAKNIVQSLRFGGLNQIKSISHSVKINDGYMFVCKAMFRFSVYIILKFLKKLKKTELNADER